MAVSIPIIMAALSFAKGLIPQSRRRRVLLAGALVTLGAAIGFTLSPELAEALIILFDAFMGTGEVDAIPVFEITPPRIFGAKGFPVSPESFII